LADIDIFFASFPLSEGSWFHCFFYVAANAYSKFIFLKICFQKGHGDD